MKQERVGRRRLGLCAPSPRREEENEHQKRAPGLLLGRVMLDGAAERRLSARWWGCTRSRPGRRSGRLRRSVEGAGGARRGGAAVEGEARADGRNRGVVTDEMGVRGQRVLADWDVVQPSTAIDVPPRCPFRVAPGLDQNDRHLGERLLELEPPSVDTEGRLYEMARDCRLLRGVVLNALEASLS
jgi:hypothetical protein